MLTVGLNICCAAGRTAFACVAFSMVGGGTELRDAFQDSLNCAIAHGSRPLPLDWPGRRDLHDHRSGSSGASGRDRRAHRQRIRCVRPRAPATGLSPSLFLDWRRETEPGQSLIARGAHPDLAADLQRGRRRAEGLRAVVDELFGGERFGVDPDAPATECPVAGSGRSAREEILACSCRRCPRPGVGPTPTTSGCRPSCRPPRWWCRVLRRPRRTFLRQREFQPPMYSHWPSGETATPLAVLICVPGNATQPRSGDHSSTPPVSAPAIACSTLTALRPRGSPVVTDYEAVIDRGDVVADRVARELALRQAISTRTRRVKIDVETSTDRCHLIHDVQLCAAVGPERHVDAVRPELQRVEIGLRDEPWGPGRKWRGTGKSHCRRRVRRGPRTAGRAARSAPSSPTSAPTRRRAPRRDPRH